MLEQSTGFSGAFARQTTLNQSTFNDSRTTNLLHDLEMTAAEGGIILQAEGVFISGTNATRIALEFNGSTYADRNSANTYTRANLIAQASSGTFIGTFTGRLGLNVDLDNPQPAIWSKGPIQEQRGEQYFPILYATNLSMEISSRHLKEDANIILNGRQVTGSISITNATHDKAAVFDQYTTVTLNSLPASGMHFLQLQNPNGLFSNDYIIFSGTNGAPLPPPD